MAIEDYFTSTVTRKVLSKSDSVYGKDGAESFSGTTTFLARIWKLKANEVVLDESQRPLVTNRAACGASNTVLYTDRWAIEGADLLDSWDFTDGWRVFNGSIIDNNTFTTGLADGNVSQSGALELTIGSTYHLQVAGSTTASGADVRQSDAAGDNDVAITSSLNEDVVFEATKPYLYIKNASAGSTTITTLILREVFSTYDIISVNLNEDKTSSHHYELELRLV